MNQQVEIAMTNHDFHSFEIDPNLINDLIYRQNGTLATALRELVMNAFDANSKRVEVLIWREGFSVVDFGEGFADETTILRNFKRFGTPHQEGDAVYGRFRIGRGQIMAFAETTWHSKNFKMISRRKSEGGLSGFILQKDADFVDGCQVTGMLYESITEYDVSRVIDDLTELVRYSPWPVFINQIQVNSHSGLIWDYEDDKIQILFNPSRRHGVHLYSLGIHVKELQLHRYGIAADIVTKQALQLNMARNEINEHDPLWHHVHKTLREELRKRMAGTGRMTESERQALIDQFQSGEIGFLNILELPILKDARGKSSSLIKELRKKRPWTFCENNQIAVADKISTQGSALVLPRSELNIWGVTNIQELLRFCKANLGDCPSGRNARIQYLNLLSSVQIVEFEQVSLGVSDEYNLVKLSDLKPIERAQRNALQYVVNNMCSRLAKLNQQRVSKREVKIGISHALAWTDSSSYIAVNKETLSLFENGIQGITQLCLILMHELTHTSGSIVSHGHDMGFYENFHDSIVVGTSINKDILGNAIVSLKNRYSTELERLNLPFPKWMADRQSSAISMTLSGNKPTPLFAWFLELVGVPFVKKRGCVQLQFQQANLWDFETLFLKKLDAAIRTHGLPVVKCEDFGYLSDYDEKIRKFFDTKIPVVIDLLRIKGISISDSTAKILVKLHTPGYELKMKCPFGGLSLLTESDEFGVKSLHNEYRRNVKMMAGKGFIFKSNFKDDWRSGHLNAASFADGGKESRFAYCIGILEDLVGGITDTTERQEFVERVFNDQMKKALIT